MSQAEPLPVLTEPAARPTSVTVMAIIGIIIGAMGFLCTPMALFPYYMQLPKPDPVIEAVKNDSLMFGWMIAGLAMNWVLSLLLLAGSIAALGLRDWARQILIGWAMTNILLTLVQLVYQFLYYFPKLREVTADQPKAVAAATSVGLWVGTGIAVVMGLGFPAVMIYIMTRPHVKDAFARGLRRIV
jgi:hypothetical protein